jgi:hypothetical protein
VGQANVVTAWNGSTTPVAVTAGANVSITGGVISTTTGDPNVVTAWNGSTTPVAVTAGDGITIYSGVITSSAALHAFGSLIYDGNTLATDFSAPSTPVPLVVGGSNLAYSFGSYEADFSTGVIRYLGSDTIITQFTVSMSYKILSGSQPYIISVYHYIAGGTGWVPIPHYEKTVTPFMIPFSTDTLIFDVYITGAAELSVGDRLGIWVTNTMNTASFFMTNLSFMAVFLVGL